MSQLRIFHEKYIPTPRPGVVFRTRRSRSMGLPSLMGKGSIREGHRVVQIEEDPEKWKDEKYRKEVYDSLGMAGFQVVTRFELDEGAPSNREVELEKLLAAERAHSAELEKQLEALVVPDTKRKPGRPKKD